MANYDLTYEGSVVQDILDTGKSLEDNGYIFMGAATTSTAPGTPTERVAYIGGPGTYNNFGSTTVVPSGSVGVFKYNGSAWVNDVIAATSDGCFYAGIATPTTNPGTPTSNVFYVAVTAGTYTNFGGLTVTQGINILKYNGSAWSVEQVVGIDDEPTAGSENLVKSGGTFKDIKYLSSNGLETVPYTSVVASSYINTSGVVTSGAVARNVHVYRVLAGQIYIVGGVTSGGSVRAWALYSDSSLTNLVKYGEKADDFSSALVRCDADGYLAVSSFQQNSAMVSNQTMYASLVATTKKIVGDYADKSFLSYSENGLVDLTWVDGYYLKKANGEKVSSTNYCYCLLDVTTLTGADAIRVHTHVVGGSSICAVGYIDNHGAYNLLVAGSTGGEQSADIDIVPSQYEMRLLIIGTTKTYKHRNYVTKLVRNIYPQPLILCQGDSLVQWSSPQSVSDAITVATGIATLNTAVGGENSTCITGRDGAIPMFLTGLNKGTLTVTNTQIEVEIWDEFCERRLPLRAQSASNPSISNIYIEGIPFTLSVTGEVPPDTGSGEEPDFSNVHYYITPAISFSGGYIFTTPYRVVTYAGINFRNYIPLTQMGANDAFTLDNYEDRAPKLIMRHKAIVAFHAQKEYFVLGAYPIALRSLEANQYMQRLYREAFGYRFIDVRQYLVDYGLSLCNITPTEGDEADIAVGVVPRSLRLSAGTHHLIDAAQTAMCNYVVARVKYFMKNE